MKNRGLLALLACAALALAGCHNGGHSQNTTDMRVLNAVADAEPLDVLVDDGVQDTAVAADSASSYKGFSSGTHDLKVRSNTLGSVLLDKSIAFPSANETLVIYGRRAAIASVLLADDTADASSGKFKLRTIGLSPDSGAVDIYLVNGDISNVPATIPSVNYGTANDFSEITAGSYQVVFTSAGTKDVLFQGSARDFSAGAKLTLAVLPSNGGKLLNAMLLTSGADGGTFLSNPLGRVKAVNAIPDAPALNFKSDGTVLLSNVPFTGVSSYVPLTATSHTLSVEAANVPGQAVASLAKSIDPARDYTIVASGTYSSSALVALGDDNSVPAANFARIRFVNMMVGSTGVDALVNFATQAGSLGFGSASSYYTLSTGATYTVTFATVGGITVLATLPDVTIDSGGVYTAYLFGTPATPQARIIRDR